MDLTYPITLLQQALVLLDQAGSEQEWLTWAAETRKWLRELNAPGELNDPLGREAWDGS